MNAYYDVESSLQVIAESLEDVSGSRVDDALKEMDHVQSDLLDYDDIEFVSSIIARIEKIDLDTLLVNYKNWRTDEEDWTFETKFNIGLFKTSLDRICSEKQ